jgi:hypothetical protein
MHEYANEWKGPCRKQKRFKINWLVNKNFIKQSRIREGTLPETKTLQNQMAC